MLNVNCQVSSRKFSNLLRVDCHGLVSAVECQLLSVYCPLLSVVNPCSLIDLSRELSRFYLEQHISVSRDYQLLRVLPELVCHVALQRFHRLQMAAVESDLKRHQAIAVLGLRSRPAFQQKLNERGATLDKITEGEIEGGR